MASYPSTENFNPNQQQQIPTTMNDNEYLSSTISNPNQNQSHIDPNSVPPGFSPFATIFLPENISQEDCIDYAFATNPTECKQGSLFTPYAFEPQKLELQQKYTQSLMDNQPAEEIDQKLSYAVSHILPIHTQVTHDLPQLKIRQFSKAVPNCPTLTDDVVALLAHVGGMFIKTMTTKSYATARARRKNHISKRDVDLVVLQTPQLQFLRPLNVSSNDSTTTTSTTSTSTSSTTTTTIITTTTSTMNDGDNIPQHDNNTLRDDLLTDYDQTIINNKSLPQENQNMNLYQTQQELQQQPPQDDEFQSNQTFNIGYYKSSQLHTFSSQDTFKMPTQWEVGNKKSTIATQLSTTTTNKKSPITQQQQQGGQHQQQQGQQPQLTITPPIRRSLLLPKRTPTDVIPTPFIPPTDPLQFPPPPTLSFPQFLLPHTDNPLEFNDSIPLEIICSLSLLQADPRLLLTAIPFTIRPIITHQLIVYLPMAPQRTRLTKKEKSILDQHQKAYQFVEDCLTVALNTLEEEIYNAVFIPHTLTIIEQHKQLQSTTPIDLSGLDQYIRMYLVFKYTFYATDGLIELKIPTVDQNYNITKISKTVDYSVTLGNNHLASCLDGIMPPSDSPVDLEFLHNIGWTPERVQVAITFRQFLLTYHQQFCVYYQDAYKIVVQKLAQDDIHP